MVCFLQVFSVEVHHNNNVHTVDKRYTDFEELHKQVRSGNCRDKDRTGYVNIIFYLHFAQN